MAEDIGILSGLTPREDYIPNLQSVYGDIIQNAADYQYFTAPLSNQGRTTATYGGQNNIVVAPDTPVRVVNNATGEVVYSGVGYEGAQGAIDAANALSASTGKKANWDIQVAGPTMQGFQSVSTDRPDTSALDVAAKVAGTALPIAVGFIPGFGQLATGLQIAAGAGAGAAGAGLRGDNILKGAIMGGLSSAGGTIVGDALRSGTNLGANAARAIGTGIGTTAGGVVTGQGLENALLSGVASGGLSYLGGEAFGKRGGTTTGDAGSIGSSGVELGDFVVTAGIPRFSGGVFTPSFGDRAQMGSDQADPYGTGIFSAGPTVDDSLLVTGSRGPTTGSSSVNVTPGTSGLTKDELVVTGDRAPTTGSTTVNVTPGASGTTPDEIVVTGDKTDPKLTGTSLTPTNLLDQITDEQVRKDLEKGKADDKDKKVTDTISDAIKYAGTAGTIYDLINRLLGGGGDGTVPGVPYTSPFGGGATLNLGGRTQINPNIADYERYGFGPEALFFSQGQNIPYVPPVTTATTGGTTTGGTTTGGTTRTTTGQTGVISQPRMTNTTDDDVTVPAATTAPTLLPNMVSSLGPTATSAQIEGALANAKTAQEATKINPGTVYYNIDTATADALGDRGLIGDVMSIQQLQQAMAARELTDPNKFATNLFQQIGEQYNKGVLNIDQARAIQQQIQQEQARTGASTQNMQNIFNTAMQQYKPLI